jgi:hypothetical protein
MIKFNIIYFFKHFKLNFKKSKCNHQSIFLNLTFNHYLNLLNNRYLNNFNILLLKIVEYLYSIF